ncbi:hypothetical protein [Agromyces humi]|uniref:hypothetical protein n=1 Tax=Agromyces humi TaxID=1766800 RepID=UPI001356C3AB|nr:hypothetical protein [Agromyces humi]
MSHSAQIIGDFREAIAGVSSDRIDNHVDDLRAMAAALAANDEASMKRVIESPRWVISGARLNRLCIAAQLFRLNFPNDWQEGFQVSEDRWQLPRGSLTRLLDAWGNVHTRLN